MMKTKILAGLLFFFLLISVSSYASQEARVLRFPTIHDDQIVFSYAGDLYTVSSEGGFARQLTSHKGLPTLPQRKTQHFCLKKNFLIDYEKRF